jgi:hypothetical protein
VPVVLGGADVIRPRSFSPEISVAVFFAAAASLLLAPFWLSGRTPFWGDLTYLHQAWRASPAASIQAGAAPLWEPSLYFGMPMAASMQGGLFYPPTILFFNFHFVDAVAMFHWIHFFLAGFLTTLWLRTLRLAWGPCAGGGLSLALGGVLISRIPFLNHLAVLAWAPALAIFFRRPAALGAALALMFLAGYPTFIPGTAAAAWGLAWALRRRREGRPSAWAADWALAGVAALAVCGAQLVPALELTSLSRRSAGVGLTEALTWGFRLGDLRQWLSPLFVPLSAFRPEVDWWKCVYLGVVASSSAGYGLWVLPRRRAAAVAALLAAVVLLILGSSNPVSLAVWRHLPLLRWIRYPGNVAYMALLPLAMLAAVGLAHGEKSEYLVAAMALELLAFGWISTPSAPRAIFTEAGPLVRALQARLGETRYLISPRALEASSGAGVEDWKTRLYGLTNAPYRLSAVANFGEPLVPAPNYTAMDRVLSAASLSEAAAWMPWLGASRLLTPEPASSPLLVREERELWHLSRTAQPAALAYLLSEEAGSALPADMPTKPPPPPAVPLVTERSRADRFTVSGEGAGWVYVAEPRYPGWRVQLVTPRGEGAAVSFPALGPFQKVAVSAGPWTIRFRYDPASWHWGVVMSVAALLAAACYWYHRVSRMSHVTR